jgi:hypothetical protein
MDLLVVSVLRLLTTAGVSPLWAIKLYQGCVFVVILILGKELKLPLELLCCVLFLRRG